MGPLFPEAVGGIVRPRAWVQYGRVERRGGKHAAFRRSGGVPARDGGGAVWPAGGIDRSGGAPAFRHEGASAHVSGKDRRPDGPGREVSGRVRHRTDVPHRLLGAPFCRGVRLGGGLEGSDAPVGGQASSVDHRAECDHEFQEPHHAGAMSRQYHRAGAFSEGGYDHRGLRRDSGTRDDVAGDVAVGDAAVWAGHVGAFELYAYAAGKAVFPRGTGRPLGGGVQLRGLRVGI